jgi:hypothetical protein
VRVLFRCSAFLVGPCWSVSAVACCSASFLRLQLCPRRPSSKALFLLPDKPQSTPACIRNPSCPLNLLLVSLNLSSQRSEVPLLDAAESDQRRQPQHLRLHRAAGSFASLVVVTCCSCCSILSWSAVALSSPALAENRAVLAVVCRVLARWRCLAVTRPHNRCLRSRPVELISARTCHSNPFLLPVALISASEPVPF